MLTSSYEGLATSEAHALGSDLSLISLRRFAVLSWQQGQRLAERGKTLEDEPSPSEVVGLYQYFE